MSAHPAPRGWINVPMQGSSRLVVRPEMIESIRVTPSGVMHTEPAVRISMASGDNWAVACGADELFQMIDEAIVARLPDPGFRTEGDDDGS